MNEVYLKAYDQIRKHGTLLPQTSISIIYERHHRALNRQTPWQGSIVVTLEQVGLTNPADVLPKNPEKLPKGWGPPRNY